MTILPQIMTILPSMICQCHFKTNVENVWHLFKSCKRLGTHSKTRNKP